MGKNDDKYSAAKKYYCMGKNIEEISKLTGISATTLYSRKKADEWDRAKEAYAITPSTMIEIITAAAQQAVLKLKDHPEDLLNPGIADAITKVVATLKKYDKSVDYIGVASDMIQEITDHIIENYPKQKEWWEKVLPEIFDIFETKWKK